MSDARRRLSEICLKNSESQDRIRSRTEHLSHESDARIAASANGIFVPKAAFAPGSCLAFVRPGNDESGVGVDGDLLVVD